MQNNKGGDKMQRILKISKYRNIGLDKPEIFIINHSIKKGEIGNLIILIGANNSGKSNVLDALESIEKRQLFDRDVTTLSFDPKDRIPLLSFGIRDNDNSITYNLEYGEQCYYHYKIDDEAIPNKEELKTDIETAFNFLKKYSMSDLLIDLYDKIENFDGKITRDFADEIALKIDEVQREFEKKYGKNGFVDVMPSNGYWRRHHNLSLNSAEEIENYCKRNYGLSLLPSIIYYKEMTIGSSDLQSSPSGVKNNSFFKSLFKAIDVNPEEINNAYDQYRQFHNPATLAKIKRQLDKKISILNTQFNKLYFAESDKYKFTISLSDNSVSFGMARGKEEDPIMIEYQSTGFKWFFNFFFNFLGSNKLKAGDIVIMDEPATNLHPKGQQELRSFIKDFARKNDITFIIATHSPFLIDPDNYDELRVISMENNRSKIDNLFCAVNDDDPDSLLPIKESLTIEQNVLYNLDTEVVWVEGITDYNYLTMFKKLLNEKNISFLPYKGVGTSDAIQKKILNRLISIKFHKRNILVDGDTAGLKMKEICKDTVFDSVVCISDLNNEEKKFIEIEDLFSNEDRKKYNLPDKTAKSSSIMKNVCTLESFTDETISNFKSLFALLKD